MSTFTIQGPDALQLAADAFEMPEHATQKGLILLSSATGIRRAFYQPLAQYLASCGYTVWTWDYSGIGDSKHSHASMQLWGQRDLEAVIQAAKQQYPEQKLYLVGHSSGGHLAGLAPSIEKIDSIVLIASGTCDWRSYPRAQWIRLWAIWWLAVPLLVTIFGYLPAWAGVGHHLPKGVVRDWRRWSLMKDYLFSDASLDTTGYAQYQGALLSLSMPDDLSFSPPKSVKKLNEYFVKAYKTIRQIDAQQEKKGIGHFGFFKRSNSHLWLAIVQWLEADAATPLRHTS
jgi:predicted alpha/beta hydrolase